MPTLNTALTYSEDPLRTVSEFAVPLPNLSGDIVPDIIFSADTTPEASRVQLSGSVDEVFTVF
jgi:hypothetical protein